jgi:hypothetical protein
VALRIAPEARVTHFGTMTTGGRGSATSMFLIARNELLFARKQVPPPARRAALLRVAARQTRWALLLERRGHVGLASNVLAGVLAGVAGLRGRPRGLSIPRACTRVALRHALATARRLEAAAARATR